MWALGPYRHVGARTIYACCGRRHRHQPDAPYLLIYLQPHRLAD